MSTDASATATATATGSTSSITTNDGTRKFSAVDTPTKRKQPTSARQKSSIDNNNDSSSQQIPSLLSGQSSSTQQSGIIDTLLKEYGYTTCKEFVDQKFNDPKEDSKKGSYKSPPNNVTTPLPIRGEGEALDKFTSMLALTIANLRQNGRGPRNNNKVEKDSWDTLSVLGYSLVQKLHSLVVAKCTNNGTFQCRNIDQLGSKEVRGTYRLRIKNTVKTGLSNNVRGGIIIRTAMQLIGKELEDGDIYDEEADEEDKKGMTVNQAKKILDDHKEEVAFYFTVDEQMDMIKEDKSIMEIVNAIGMIAPAFYGWDESLLDKRNEEILNYGFEAVCACSFTGSLYHNVMEMFFNLASTKLRQMIELPPSESIKLVVELLMSRGLTPEQIKCIFTWGTSTTALRKKRVTLLADTDNSSNIKLGEAVGDMIRDFQHDDPAGFLQLFENQVLFGSKSILHVNAYPSQTYAKVVTVARSIHNVLESNSDNKQEEVITLVQELYDLDRYDDPKGSDSYVSAVNNTLVEVKQDVNSGMLVIENTMKSVSSFSEIFPAYENSCDIKNADGTVAGTILSVNNDSSPLILTLPSLHPMRGVKVTDKQRFMTRQAQLSIMKCLCDAGRVREITLETQHKSAYSQLLWTEGIGDNDANVLMSDESNTDKCDGSSEKGRMVALPKGMSAGGPIKEGVDFVGKLMSGKYVFDADSNPSLREVVTDVSIDNVVVACLVAELGLDNFATMLDIGYGINSRLTGTDFLEDGKQFSTWLISLKDSLGRREESRKSLQGRYNGDALDSSSDDGDDDFYEPIPP